eukprot:17392-Heterococcus_DN1.PRE.2
MHVMAHCCARTAYTHCDVPQEIWGGRNQHVGLYESPELENMPAAARVIEACDLATRKLFSKARPSRGSRVIEFGSGFGGTARHAAAAYDVDVTCVDLSRRANEVSLTAATTSAAARYSSHTTATTTATVLYTVLFNQINRKLTDEAGLLSHVHIKSERSFFETGESDGAFSMVFSQDALCHAADQTGRALDEAARLLREGGLLAFTNIVVDPQARSGDLRQVLARLQLPSMESPDSLIAAAEVAGFELIEFEDTTPSLVQHFTSILEVLASKRESLEKSTSLQYVSDAVAGLKAWESAGNNGTLRWGYFVFRKPVTVSA